MIDSIQKLTSEESIELAVTSSFNYLNTKDRAKLSKFLTSKKDEFPSLISNLPLRISLEIPDFKSSTDTKKVIKERTKHSKNQKLYRSRLF